MSSDNKKMWRTAVPILELDTKTDEKPKNDIPIIHQTTIEKRSMYSKYVEIIQNKIRSLMKNNEKIDKKPFTDISIDENSSMEGVNPGFVESIASTSRETLNQKKSTTPPSSCSEFHPRPPFSCTPVYIFILVALFLVLIVGVIHTVIALRPTFLYPNNDSNSTLVL